MKKSFLYIFFFFSIQTAMAQNEVKLNIANTIAIASVEVGYERFLDSNQSVEVGFLINDRINYHTEKGARNFNTNSVLVGYNFYFGDGIGSGVFVSPFAKYRTGNFEDEITVEQNGVSTNVLRKTDMDAFIIGLGGGYKWNFNDTFTMGPSLNVARNFSDAVKERFSAVEFNAGFSIGYRF